jgi:sugar phosphate isomerase/epimerase
MPVLKRNGFNFYYHNHGFEYTDVFNGKYAMDIMLENTDPALFSMQFHYSGLPADLDLVKYIRNLGGRLTKLHFAVLDNAGNPAVRQDLIEAAKESGSCKWFILEQNYPDLATASDRLKRSVDIAREILNK